MDYLDEDGNGELDVIELDHALKKAHRESIGKDPMHLIADRLGRDPYSNILHLSTGPPGCGCCGVVSHVLIGTLLLDSQGKQ